MRYVYGFDKSMPAEQVFRELKSVFQHHAPGKVASLKFDTYLNGHLRTVTIEIPDGEGPDGSRHSSAEMMGAHHDENLGQAKKRNREDDSVNDDALMRADQGQSIERRGGMEVHAFQPGGQGHEQICQVCSGLTHASWHLDENGRPLRFTGVGLPEREGGAESEGREAPALGPLMQDPIDVESERPW